MQPTIGYYFATQSPWTYLGHTRFAALAQGAGASVRVMPVDMGKIFAVSGGLPLGKRAPQRQAYRLVELRRFAEYLGLPLNLQPRFFPVQGDEAARLIIAVEQLDGAGAAMRLTGAVLAAVWAQERDIASAEVLAALLSESGLDAARLAQARAAQVQQAYESHTQGAIDEGVFGAPTYTVSGEMFWGQDRLDFLERRLRAV